METVTLKVLGMHCPKCDARVEKAVGDVSGVASVKADHEKDEVVIEYSGDAAVLEAAKAAIIEQEFEVA